MHKKPFVLAAAAVLALAAGAAHADRGVSWSVGVSLPGVTTVVGGGPRVYAPPVAYYPPAAAYYAPAPAYYAPPPLRYVPAPGYVAPGIGYGPPAYYPRPRFYGPQLMIPPVARVEVPYRHHGWRPAEVVYAPPMAYGPGVVGRPYGPYERRWR